MKLSHKQKKYLKKNLSKKSLEVLVSELGVSVEDLEVYLKKKGKKNWLAKLQVLKDRGENIESIRSLVDIKRHWLGHRYVFLLFTVLCLGVYFSVLDGEFVFDDFPTIVENGRLGDVWWSFKTSGGFQALKSVVFLLFGRSVIAYHSLNLLFHVLAVWSAYFFVLIVTERWRVATFASLLFALHPVNSEVVCWISAGHYVLSAFLFFVSIIFYHLYLEDRRKVVYLVGVVSAFTTALVFSTWVFPLPAVYFLYEKLLRKRKINWPFYLALAGVCIFRAFWLRGDIATRVLAVAESSGGLFTDVTVTIPHILTQNLYLLVWPIKLTLYREGDTLTSVYLFGARVFALFFLFVLPFIFRKSKLFIFFFLFFLISIAISLSPIWITSGIAERYLYLGSLSFCVLVAYLLVWLEDRLKVKKLAIVLLIPLLSFYFVRTYLRNRDWQSPAALWEATAKVSPYSWRTHNSLGGVYRVQKDWDRAIKEFELANKLRPTAHEPVGNLGDAYLEMGDLEKSEEYLLAAIEIEPNYPEAFYNLGVLSIYRRDREAAESYFERSLEINPSSLRARKALEALRSGE